MAQALGGVRIVCHLGVRDIGKNTAKRLEAEIRWKFLGITPKI